MIKRRPKIYGVYYTDADGNYHKLDATRSKRAARRSCKRWLRAFPKEGNFPTKLHIRKADTTYGN